MHLFYLSPARVQIRVFGADEFGPVEDLVADVHDDENDERDVGDEETTRVPGDESGEALGKDDEDVPEHAIVGEVWLEQ